MSVVFKEEVPFLRLLICFILGIGISIYFNLEPYTFWIYGFVTLFIVLVALNLGYKNPKIYQLNFLSGAIIHLMVCLAAMIITNQNKEIYNPLHFSKFNCDELIVRLKEDPKIKGDIARVLVGVDGVIINHKIKKTTGNLLLAIRIDTTSKVSFKYGDQLLIPSKFREIDPPYNPAEFNYKKFLSYKQVYHQSFIKQSNTFTIDSNMGNFILAFALKSRELQVDKFRKYLPDAEARAVASTLILGYRTNLSQDILQIYSKSGTLHVLSVSGMHVAILVVFLEFLLGFMNRKKWTKLLKAFLMIVLVWSYCIIAGLVPAVERAAIMITLFIIGKILMKRVNPFNIIAFSAFAILLLDPFALMDIGFQLSYIAVSGLVYIQPKIQKQFLAENKMVEIIWSCISIAIAAQLATSAVSMYYFHQFPLCFIFTNVFIMLPATLMMYGGVVFLIVPWPIWVMHYLGLLLNQLIVFTNKVLFYIIQMPGSNLTNIHLHILEIALLYLILILIWLAFSKRNVLWMKWAMAFTFIFMVSTTFKNIRHSRQQQAMFFSLRKNSAVAIIKGKTAVLISDLDSSNNTLQFSVKPYLDSCQIKHITYINPYKNNQNSIYTFLNKKLNIHQNPNIGVRHKADYVILNANQIFDLKKIKFHSNVNLFITGRNRDFIIHNYEEQAKELGLPFHTLKRSAGVEIKF